MGGVRPAVRLWPGILVLALAGCSPVVSVAPGQAVQADPGDVLRLEPGPHRGPIVIDHPLTLVGDEGAVVWAPPGEPGVLVKDVQGVNIRRLTVRGGEAGVVVRGSTRVTVEDVTVAGSRRWGILAQDSQVRVSGCRVAGLASPFARGVEVINSELRPASTIQGCRVTGPVYEGIVSRFSKVSLLDNRVEGSILRGVAINEMSMGRMEGNRVSSGRGSAFACGDMSLCEMLDNRAERIGSTGEGGLGGGGNGAVVQYHSQAFIRSLSTSELAGRDVLLSTGSSLLAEPASSTGAGAGAWSVLAVLVGTVAFPLLLSRHFRVAWPPVMLLMAMVVQVAHQLEHTVQVAQVHLLHAWQTHGLAGAVFDQEWVHLGFNSVLWVALVVALAGYGKERWDQWRREAPVAFLALAVAIATQTYHVVEHLVKIAQHVTTGAAPAPGVLGRAFDLVSLHFGINLVVTTGLAIGCLGLGIGAELVGRRADAAAPSRRVIAPGRGLR